MASTSAIDKNNRRKGLVKKHASKRETLLLITKDKNASFQDRLEAQIKLSEMPRNGSKIRVRNRCSITGRPRGYYRDFDMSRISLRELAGWGLIVGLTKSSW